MLAAPPEKGILKKQGSRSTEALPLKALASFSAAGEPSYRAMADSPYLVGLESEYIAIGEPEFTTQVNPLCVPTDASKQLFYKTGTGYYIDNTRNILKLDVSRLKRASSVSSSAGSAPSRWTARRRRRP